MKIFFDDLIIFLHLKTFRKVDFQLCCNLQGLGQTISHMWCGIEEHTLCCYQNRHKKVLNMQYFWSNRIPLPSGILKTKTKTRVLTIIDVSCVSVKSETKKSLYLLTLLLVSTHMHGLGSFVKTELRLPLNELHQNI